MLRTFAVISIALTLALVGQQGTALADSTPKLPVSFEMFNPCAPEDGLIAFTGFTHSAIVTHGDLTVFPTISHFEGISEVTGTHYVLNIVAVLTSAPSTTYLHRGTISRGSGDDSWLTMRLTPPPAVVVEYTCRG